MVAQIGCSKQRLVGLFVQEDGSFDRSLEAGPGIDRLDLAIMAGVNAVFGSTTGIPPGEYKAIKAAIKAWYQKHTKLISSSNEKVETLGELKSVIQEKEAATCDTVGLCRFICNALCLIFCLRPKRAALELRSKRVQQKVESSSSWYLTNRGVFSGQAAAASTPIRATA
jgi:hypothetical protein